MLHSNTESQAFFNTQVKKAKKFMAAQMYQQAIELLDSRINKKPTDADAHFLVAEAYLYTGNYRSAAERFDSAVKLEPELKTQVASVCLKALDDTVDIATTNEILLIADIYATNDETKQTIGHKEKLLASMFKGSMKEDLLKRAAGHLGDGEVYGFEIIELSPKSIKVVLYTDEPVKVMDWRKGTRITFLEASNPDKIKRYYSMSQKILPIPLGHTRIARSDLNLEFQGEKHAFVVLRIE
jgi:tetratricopeptide (TPR) repeat protein